jgi:hypothetical protein
MTLQHLYQEIHNVLKLHGASNRTDTVISAMADLGLIGIPKFVDDSNESAGAAAAPGTSSRRASALLAGTPNVIAVSRALPKDMPETARGWLDIDGGIYFDVRQHGAGSDSER